MNSKINLSGCFFIFILLNLNLSYAQDENLPVYLSNVDPARADAMKQEGWKGAYLTIAGTNIIDGVEVFTKLDKCESEDFVMIKFINHNGYDVIIEWVGGIYTKDRQWLGAQNNPVSKSCNNKESNPVKSSQNTEGIKSITIKANGEVTGDCLSDTKLKENIDIADNFNRYAPSLFEVSKVYE